jgi:hypothetical protein
MLQMLENCINVLVMLQNNTTAIKTLPKTIKPFKCFKALQQFSKQQNISQH